MTNKGRFLNTLIVALLTMLLLSIIQYKTAQKELPLLLFERFFAHGGWLQVILIVMYASVVMYFMQDIKHSAQWRRYTWFLFSMVFYSQLVLGVFADSMFLMSGTLHIPVPLMILSGPIFRGEVTFMVVLFLTTIILSGPAWCSHFCYFGAIDNFFASKKKSNKHVEHLFALKHAFLVTVIAITLLLRLVDISILWAVACAISFGVAGLSIAVFISSKRGRMLNCVVFCPIGTIVNYIKFVNPFRFKIASSCTMCMKCVSYCQYDALTKEALQNKQPLKTCTLCGDCLPSCSHQSLHYSLFGLKPDTARIIYLCITISFHAICLAVARI